MWATAVNHPAGASANSITINNINNQHMTVSMTEIQNVSSSVMAPYPWDHHHHLRHNNQQNDNQEHLVHQQQHHQHQQQQQLDDPSVSFKILFLFSLLTILWFMDFHIHRS